MELVSYDNLEVTFTTCTISSKSLFTRTAVRADGIGAISVVAARVWFQGTLIKI